MEKNVYRIIDANFNRAREACRMAEEYCRFALNCSTLTSRTKKIRHDICTVIAKLEQGKLLANRDTPGDVGAAKQIKGQMTRNSLQDCFTAACKRLTEALRVLSEMTATFDKDSSLHLERLRFQAYSLEKDVMLFADAAGKFSRVRLYVIITSSLPADIINLTNQCIKGGADCIQLRAKQMPNDQLYAAAKEMTRLCKDADVISIINDRIDIAVAAGADGVHLGQNDLPPEQAKQIASAPMIIGKSTHNIEQLKKAIEELPSYVGLGPVFSTGTKPDTQPVGLDYISKAAAILKDYGIGHAAIGGINPDNADSVLKAGARTLAVCSAVTENENPAHICQLLKRKICQYAG